MLCALLAGCASSPMPPYTPLPPPPSQAPVQLPSAAPPPPPPSAISSPIGNAPDPSAPSTPDAPVSFGLSPAVELQRSRLTEALAGTPVLVGATDQRQLKVQVPMRYCFDPGQSAVKPALAAVLDQVAIGFKPQAAGTEIRIGAPIDDTGVVPTASASGNVTPIVQERAASVRDYLVGRGVPVSRIVALGRSTMAGVELAVSDRVPER